MKKLMLIIALLASTAVFADKDYTIPKNNPSAGMPSMWGGILFSKATRAMYISPRVDLRTCQVLGKVQCTLFMWNVLALVNMGDIGWEALKKEVRKKYPAADDIVNFNVDAEYLNVSLIYMHLKVNVSGFAVKYKK